MRVRGVQGRQPGEMSSGKRGGRVRRVIAWILALGVALAVFCPRAVPSTWPGVAQVIAFPAVCGVALAILVGLASTLWLRGRAVLRALGVPLAIILASAIVLVVNPDGSVPAPDEEKAAGTRITVVTWNVEGELTERDLGEVLERYHPDVVALPEYGFGRFGSPESLERWSDGEYQVFASTPDEARAPTSLMVKKTLGTYRKVEGVRTTLGSVTAIPDNASLPTLMAVHVAAPVSGLMSEWRADLRRIVEAGDSLTNVVVAGDFNATLRHGALLERSSLVDSVQATRTLAAGTWPASAPQIFASPIDHILTAGWSPRSTIIDRVGTSDHKFLVATLER